MLQGYCRVSTADQNPDAQRDALIRAGVEPAHLYVDHTSGAKSSRPQWDAVYKALRDGDVLVATRLDRVGRSTTHLVGLLDELGSRGVAFKFLEQGIDTTTSEGRLMYRMLAAIAEFQRDLITANTREGLAAARARGRKGGRKPKLSRAQMQLAQQLYDAGEKTVAQIAALFGVPRTTVYGHLDTGSVGGRPRAKKSTAISAPASSAPTVSSLSCPTCGHTPTSRPEARQQRADLATVWLDQPTAHTPIAEHTHCVHCQPHVPTASLTCVRCGDGPLLTGILAEHVHTRPTDELPSALRSWLAERGWQITPELLCPHDS
jgi:DNA invertase Pin-like site-specific DNA recombinase